MRDSSLSSEDTSSEAPFSAGGSASERMSNVDAAWLRMEKLTNQMTITAVLTFGAPVSRADFRRVVEERLLRFDRLRRRVRRSKGVQNPRWEPDPHFDLDYHVRGVELPAPGGKEQLQELASRLMSRPLDFSRPLWQFHVVDGYDGGGAAIARFHHCIADGVTLVRVLLSLTDATPDAPLGGAPGDSTADALLGVDAADETPPASATQRLTAALKRIGRTGAQAAEGMLRGAGVLGKLAWPSPDPDTVFRGELGRRKKAAWSEAVPLPDVKAVGRALGGTVNDVLLTAVTGALGRYLERHGQRAPGLDVRAAVPVNLRPLDAPLTMGNAFGLVFLALPVGTRDPTERLRVLRRRMDRLKSSPEAPMLLGVLAAVGGTTQAVEDRVVRYLARKLTAVATNVPGPQQTRYLAGAPMETLMAWVPQAGRVGLGLSVISYDGDVRLGIATDAGLVPDPEPLVEAFHHEFDALRAKTPERRGGDASSSRDDGGASGDEETGDGRGDDRGDDQPPPHEENPDRCQATTKAGAQCKLPAQDDARFCHVHGDG
jgi:WS/DGAT/MGAT family acyltransferase